MSLFSVTLRKMERNLPVLEATNEKALPQDTQTKYPVRKTQITNYEDLVKKQPIDLQDPSNIQTEVDYDLKNNVYIFKTTIDNDEWITPFTLNPDEYSRYNLRKSMIDYFKMKNDEAYAKKDRKGDFSLKDIRVNTSTLERVFGPGGVQIKPQGYVEVGMGMKNSSTKNPTIPDRSRNRWMFDFNEKIQVNANASVGNKVNFGLNYDTEATFDFDTKRIKLAYDGEEDEIIRHIEAGNVSMSTTNSLINGGSSLFGIKTDLQFGKLRVSSVISQQESESQTVSSKGGVQTIPFEFKADQYDENQHFFLSQYFRATYDSSMVNAPHINSPIQITKIELWITNRQSNFDKARNIIGFGDLGEYTQIGNDQWMQRGSDPKPNNNANTLYSILYNNCREARDRNQASTVLDANGMQSGIDYDKLESARMLEESEYKLNPKLGYVSLNTPLTPDQVLAVAFSYQIGDKLYRVGEFAEDIPSKYEPNVVSGALFLKLLKPVNMTPKAYTWRLMMKNVYKLGSSQIQKDKFRLNIHYQSDTLGTYINYLPEGKRKNEQLLRVLRLDRLNSQEKSYPDGIFDYLEGLTILSENGRVIFPVAEPFGSYLEKTIGDPIIARKYVYKELYDSTLTVAQQVADKNKFRISGSFRGSTSSSVINLNAMNVAKGSVRVTANGQLLVEGVDYSVDYTTGDVIILNDTYTNADIKVSLENQSLFNMKRKTLLGVNLNYDFTKDFSLGATIMHMSEKPLSMKTGLGEESVRNTLWGVNTSYRTSSQWLTNLIDKLPFVSATAPSKIAFNAEFAQLIGGHYQSQDGGKYSYLDDFESTKSRIPLLQPVGWKLASTPSLFPESKIPNNDPNILDYGKNRAHLSWFSIDNMFTRTSSPSMPSYLKRGTKPQLTNHFSRLVNMREIYPGRDIDAMQSAAISTLSLSYYPEERGMYNLDADNMSSEGKLMNPEKRWGGIMRKLDNTNFEANNIEYIEFWMMDPFVYNDTAKVKNEGGDLYFNLGEISEDILKDGKKFYENGLPTSTLSNDVEFTPWGKVPTRQSSVYAFDNNLSDEQRRLQDAGLNGMLADEEKEYAPYKEYLEKLRAKLLPGVFQNMLNDEFSPFGTPSGDKFHHFKGADYDRAEKPILDRYKWYNGTEGNSISTPGANFTTTASTLPDVEDLNQDFTMNENESYYQYKVTLKPNQMEVGTNYITERRVARFRNANGDQDSITWYQFKIPVKDNPLREQVGNIQGFRTVRFMRMFLTNFKQTTFLRFGTLDLVRGDWRIYSRSLTNEAQTGNGVLNVAAVNIEENKDKEPVNYVIPPGVSQIVDPNQSQLLKENEQSLLLQAIDFDPRVSRAVYKNTSQDLRRYKRLQMFTHAEELIDGPTVGWGEMTVFLRLGADYTNNYYEYEVPLTVTPAGRYGRNDAGRRAVWPDANMLDFPLELLTNLKLKRNADRRKGVAGVEYNKVYSDQDPARKNNKISVIGNPSLADVSVMMIGIRNNSDRKKSVEVWANELRLTDYDDKGGWAAQGSLNIGLSDIGSINLAGRKETAGFGAIDQSMMERRMDDLSSYSVSANVNLGRFLPEKAKVTAPMYYSYSNETTTPEYDPLDQDIKLDDALKVVQTKRERDSIKNLAQEKTVTKNFSLTGVRINVASKNPMPYDPANFTFGYAYSKTESSDPTTAYDITQNYKLSTTYSYSPVVEPWQPFKGLNKEKGWAKFPKSLAINYLPNNISFNSYITRYYTETLTRDLESFMLGGDNSTNQFLSWNQNFYWDRDMSVTWDLLPNLRMSLQTGTRAEIEEPYLQVNKKLNPDDYDKWRDEVLRSLRHLGTPLSYRQTAQITYAPGFQNIPILDWINSSANYTSGYNWDRGAELFDDSDPSIDPSLKRRIEVGNMISNNLNLTLNNKFDMNRLYNKWGFLKKVNEKFDSQGGAGGRSRTQQRTQRKKKPVNLEVTLNTDSATIITHGLNSKKLTVTARAGKEEYKVKFKRVDANTIRITTKDTATIKLTIRDNGEFDESAWYKLAQYSARGLMSIRSLSANYSIRQETGVSGFLPSIADAFGQSRTGYGLTPGLGFAFGLQGGEDFIMQTRNRGWILTDGNSISPAVYNSIRKFDFDAQLEPIKGLKIRLTALHEKNNRTSFQFAGSGNATRMGGGSFAMTTIALGSSFERGNAKNGYRSKSFDNLLKYREIIARRMESGYIASRVYYPNRGFIANTGLGNQVFDPNLTPVDRNSADVLIPAFLAAYTGRNANKIALNPFPALTSLLPNWTLNYDGLTSLSWFKDHFRNVRLMHSYAAQYQVGSYSTYSDWIDAGSGFGFTQGPGVTADNVSIKPSSQFDISSVTLVEKFSPLIGIETLLNNDLRFNARYNTSRILNLNITSYQLVETLQRDLVLGASYRINEFNKLIGLPIKNDRGFNNDLNLTIDISRRTMQALIRKLEDTYTEATSGTTVMTIKLSAEYALSRSLLLRAFFDKITNTPLVSSTAYPTANTNFGISLRFTLNQ